MAKPIIGIPMGDPAGVGPEIVAKSMAEPSVYEACRPLVVGDRKVLEHALHLCRLPLGLHLVEHPRQGEYRLGTIDLVDLHNVDLSQLRIGEAQALCGKAAYEYIAGVVRFALEGSLDAVATTPINKESLRAAKVPHIGHTEILAELAGVRDPLTMFEVHGMRVFFLTRHASLRDACGMVTKTRVLDYIVRCTEALAKLGVTEGTMAVAGLNPHAGDGGLFGREEIEQVEPAVREAQALGYRVAGPIPADSVFHFALQGKYNSVLSLYHDQGHIATKTLDFERTIAITNGLPFLRTSVDHGTAFDIAGTGSASAVSMVEAIRLAAKYAPCFSEAGTAASTRV